MRNRDDVITTHYTAQSKDYPGLGMIPLGKVHQIIAAEFPLIKCRAALLRAAQRSDDVHGVATRRTWISQKAFPELLANFYFMKRFYDIVRYAVLTSNR